MNASSNHEMAQVVPVLPVNWQDEEGKVVVLQVKSIRNILLPKMNFSKGRPKKFYYRVDLTDGKSEVCGLVDTPIRGLNVYTAPGSRIRITCPVEAEDNFIFLDKTNALLLDYDGSKKPEAPFNAKNPPKVFSWTKDSKIAPYWVRVGVKLPDMSDVLTSFRAMKVNK
uniref:Uncharacterized protein n=1 Tax=Trichuris muris TaxID=70415 RepID=A0A5S6Q7Q5_TRIMR